MTNEINIMVAGEAGQGVQSIGFLMAKAFARWGYSIFADQDYESRVRGGHNFFRIRVSDSTVSTINNQLDVLIALNRESIALHDHELTVDGIIIYDDEKIKGIEGSHLLGVPIDRLAREATGDNLMANTVALGAALGLLNYDFGLLGKLLQGFFLGDLGEMNVKAADAGYKYIQRTVEKSLSRGLTPTVDKRYLLLTGNEAIALGAIAAGCKFISAYPMTPTTQIMEYLAGKSEKFGLVVVPAEDEIAAINMIVGAAYAGVRAMTATSGGGFCLMVEGVGLAGMTETPIVVVEGQRPGPAIGLPTRSEQGDLEFILHAAHGEFPRIVLAPATVEECFWMTVQAFNLADKYQTPAIILVDHHLASSYTTTAKFDLSKVTIDRGDIFKTKKQQEYKRHAFTESGISPRAFPGTEGLLVVTDSDEHDEAGHLIEDTGTRIKMMNKRLNKIVGLRREMIYPAFYGPNKADKLLIGWGSTYGAIKEATDILNENGGSYGHMHLSQLWPFPGEMVSKLMQNAHRSYVIENNATGQLAALIRRETGLKVTKSVLKYDGRPFSPVDIIDGLNSEERLNWLQ